MTGEVVWPGHPEAPAPLQAIRAAAARGPLTIVDDAGRPVAWHTRIAVCETLRGIWLRALEAATAAIASVLTPRHVDAPASAQPGRGPVTLLLPVLPDLSHTFVYREVLAILRRRPDWRVVVLARNDRAPAHPEAKELLARVEFLPPRGITGSAFGALRRLVTARGRALFALYRNQPDGSVRDLLGKLPLRDRRHPGNAFALADLLAAAPPRHLHVYSSTYAANVAMGAAHLLGVPFSISSYVDFEFPYAHKMLGEKLVRAAFCRVVTAFCRKRLLALPEAGTARPARVPVVMLGLDLANWHQQAPLAGRGVLVSAARFVAKKGLALVPPALAELRRQGVPVRWRLIGDGPEATAIAAACRAHGVEDLVDVLGPRDSAAVRDELLAADAAVLPCIETADGERDGIPIFLCEAMALGVPVVTTAVSGIPELVRDGDTGFLCAPGDAAGLARALRTALGDPATARAVAARGRAAVHRELDVDRSAAALIAEIER